MTTVKRKLLLFKKFCEESGSPFLEFVTPRPLALVEQDVFSKYTLFQYGLAHAFVGSIRNARVFGSGFLLTESGHCLLHGLTSGNYRQNLETQLKNYLVNKPVDDEMELNIDESAPFIDEEAVLLWGSNNFGHWIFTYLHRLTQLQFVPGLLEKKLLVWEGTPKRFIDWLPKMGVTEEKLVYAQDCSQVAQLWVPSVVHYRGHYTDMNVYIFPEAVHVFRHQILKERAFLIPHEEKRERIYVSRARAKWRRLINEEELVRRLTELGVRTVYLEELSVDDQIDIVSRAELIVLFAGGASPITMLAPKDVIIIELSLPGFSGIFGSRVWAQILGQRFSRVNAMPVDSVGERPNPLTDRDAMVPVENVVALIGAADSNTAGRSFLDETRGGAA